MIRGAVDYITPSAIGGWIYSDIAPVKDRLVLAFHGDECIGSGTIEMYREDLAKAGLGDGYLGFNFPITLPAEQDPTEVYVKLSDSDLILKQRLSTLVAQSAYRSIKAPKDSGLKRSSTWMRERGWIRPDECEFLTRIDELGVYSRILSRQELYSNASQQEPLPDLTISELFEVFYQAQCSVKRRHFESVTEALEFVATDLTSTAWTQGLWALWSPGPTAVSVVEGGHQGSVANTSETFSGIDYQVGPTRVVFFDKGAPVRVKGPAPSQGVFVYHCAHR